MRESILTMAAMAVIAEQMNKKMETEYSKNNPHKKTPLTKKQKKGRAKSSAARKQRRRK